jgi:propanol-preferring alcohol dehydrogenase
VTPYRAVRRAEPWLAAGARVLVIGCGALGQFALQHLRLVPAAGRELFVAVRELSPARLERATELGADLALLDGDPELTLEGLAGPADVVLDFVGTDATLAHASAVVAPDGLVVLIGEAGGSLRFGFDHPPVESWLTTVAWGSRDDLREVVRLAERGRLHWDVEPVPLAAAASALARLREGNVAGRLVVVPDAPDPAPHRR